MFASGFRAAVSGRFVSVGKGSNRPTLTLFILVNKRVVVIDQLLQVVIEALRNDFVAVRVVQKSHDLTHRSTGCWVEVDIQF
ncbi:hypothetical protein D3C73_1601510 [compost metagenome]